MSDGRGRDGAGHQGGGPGRRGERNRGGPSPAAAGRRQAETANQRHGRPNRQDASSHGRQEGHRSTGLVVRGELLYGRNGVAEALRGKRRLNRLFVAGGVREGDRIATLRQMADTAGVETVSADRHDLDAATQHANHQGVALDAGPFVYASADDILAAPGTVVALDHLQDPQNLGTLIRAAEACGAAGIILPADRAASVTPAVVNASAGAVELLPVAQVPNLARVLEQARDHGRWSIGLEDDARAVDLYRDDLPQPAVLVIGAEGPGIGPNLRRHCDVLARIPMTGRIASLNASTAGAIALFELWRREHGTEERCPPSIPQEPT